MTDEIKKDLEKILKKIENLEDIINRPYQTFEYPSEVYPQPYIPDSLGKTKCVKCGIEFNGVTSYYCSRNDCPTFTKATY